MAMPVVLLPGSILSATACSLLSSTRRSLSRITNGLVRCTTARLRASSSRARLGEQGMSGFLCLSSTNTMTLPPVPRVTRFPLRGCVTVPGWRARDAPLAHVGAACRALRTARYPERTFNARAAWLQTEEASGGAMTIPTESPRLEAVSIRDWGWTTTDLRLASPRVRRVGSLTCSTSLDLLHLGQAKYVEETQS